MNNLGVVQFFYKACEPKVESMGTMADPLLHIVPFCEGKNKKLKGFAKQKQPSIFAM